MASKDRDTTTNGGKDGPRAPVRTNAIEHPSAATVERAQGFCCHDCGAWFSVFHAPQSDVNAARAEDHVFALECPACTHSGEYSSRELVDGVAPMIGAGRKPVRPRQ